MKIIYKGKFNGDMDLLPHREHFPGAVKFREPDSPKKMALIGNTLSVVIMVIALAGVLLRGGRGAFSVIGAVLALASMFPHELLHAVCFKEDVFLYTYLSKGMMFVVGPESMSKSRFIIMSLFPNIVFGVIPYILFMVFPQLKILGTMGAVAMGMGAGDYYNVYNAAVQMPKGARTYLHKFNSYWYMPQNRGENRD